MPLFSGKSISLVAGVVALVMVALVVFSLRGRIEEFFCQRKIESTATRGTLVADYGLPVDCSWPLVSIDGFGNTFLEGERRALTEILGSEERRETFQVTEETSVTLRQSGVLLQVDPDLTAVGFLKIFERIVSEFEVAKVAVVVRTPLGLRQLPIPVPVGGREQTVVVNGRELIYIEPESSRVVTVFCRVVDGGVQVQRTVKAQGPVLKGGRNDDEETDRHGFWEWRVVGESVGKLTKNGLKVAFVVDCDEKRKVGDLVSLLSTVQKVGGVIYFSPRETVEY